MLQWASRGTEGQAAAAQALGRWQVVAGAPQGAGRHGGLALHLLPALSSVTFTRGLSLRTWVSWFTECRQTPPHSDLPGTFLLQ